MSSPATAPFPSLKRPRVALQPDLIVGPGKADLLQAIATHGSISGAARAMGMSYRRAWLLLDELHRAFGRPLIDTATGGTKGGGARINALGRQVLADYLELEQACAAAAAPALARLQSLALPRTSPGP